MTRWKRPVRHVLIVLFREDRLDSHTYRVPLWLLRAAAVFLALLAVLVLLGVAFYAPLARTAGRVPGLTREIERLWAENAQVVELATTLDSVEAGYERLRRMVGADVVPDPGAMAGAVLAARLTAPPPGIIRFVATTMPTYWPLDERGYVTRGASDSVTSGDEPHPGLDIAVREGSLVRATASGMVLEAGEASDYGLYVLLRHADGYESMYGHLSRITVRQGETLEAGGVVGLSGNTGRSTAPHLHFEIRRDGRSIDPATLVKEVS